MKTKILILVSLCSCVLVFVGCVGMSKKDKTAAAPAMLEPQGMLKFADIPVPARFKLIPQDSYTFESSGVRVAILKYQGRANVEQVVNFYKEQMPMYNWSLLNIVEYGNVLLNFDRETETCIVTLSPKGNSINIAISVGPKSQVPRKSEKPVK